MNMKSIKSQFQYIRKIPSVFPIKLICAALLLTIAGSVSTPFPALAEEMSVCVICNDPGKVYQCRFGTAETQSGYQPDQTTNLNNVNIKGLEFSCIQEIAQYGAHGQCAANRKNPTECGGELYYLKNRSAVELKPDNQPEEQPIEAARPPKQKPPTLVDETKKTYKQTTKSVQKGYNKTTETVKKGYDSTKSTVKSVGETIGDAATTTYKCITSFFNKC